jgi:predicted GNAT family N-acyltransferase
MNEGGRWVSIGEASKTYGVTVHTVRRWCDTVFILDIYVRNTKTRTKSNGLIDKITIRIHKESDIFYSQKEKNTIFGYLPDIITKKLSLPKKVLVSNICNPYGNYIFDIWADKKNYTDKKNLFLVAVNELDLVIGIALFIPNETKYVEFKAFCIEEKYGGKGIATNFIKKSLCIAKNKWKTMKTMVLVSTKDGYNLYKKNGFRDMTEKESEALEYSTDHDDEKTMIMEM